MQLEYETLDAVPEDLRESFESFKDGDAEVFIHKDLAAAKRESFRFKGDLTQAQKTAKEKADRLAELEEAQRLRDEEAEKAELENKKKNGQHEEILEDFKAKAEQREAELKQKLDDLSNTVKSKEKSSVVNELAALGTDETRSALKRLIDLDLTFGEDGGLVVLEDGKASSTTIEQYKEKLKDLYPSLVGGSHGKGGNGNGGKAGSGGHDNDVNTRAQEARKKGDLKGFLDASIKIT